MSVVRLLQQVLNVLNNCQVINMKTREKQIPENALTIQEFLDLWKFFSEDTAKIKDKLWTIASWLYGLMNGLMAFMLEDKAEEFRPVMGVVGRKVFSTSI